MMPAYFHIILIVLSWAGPIALILGLLLYPQLVRHYKRLPAAVALPDVQERLRMAEQNLSARQEEIRVAEARIGELNALKGEIDYWREQVEVAKGEFAQLDQQRSEIEAVRSDLAKALEDLARAEKSAAEQRAALDDYNARLNKLRDEISQSEPEERRLKSEIERLRPEADALAERIAKQRVELGEVQAKSESLERAAREATAAKTDAERALKETEAQAEGHRQRIDDLARQESDLRQQQQAIQSELSQASRSLEREVERLTGARSEVEQAQTKVEGLRSREMELTATIASLEATKKTLEASLSQLGIQRKDGGVGDALSEVVVMPRCFSSTPRIKRLAESDAIDRLVDQLAAARLRFSRRTLEAFHTCLKIADISPLTVLAGISGTGKSELPRRYAEAIGLEFLLVPVQPRWDGPQDLLGFYNYLEKRFKATELVQALVRLDPKWHDVVERSFDDRVLLVLLDEMNLARVEYYFSDFLSLLEIRRAHPDKAQVAIDLGAERRWLQLTSNALFVGTMNEDETTQTLSDKVIDRANLLRFTRPSIFSDHLPATGQQEREYYLPLDVWRSWHRRPADLSSEAQDKLSDWINRLNAILDSLGRPFGHRVQQAMVEYAANHPRIASNPREVRIAFIDQVEQRVFPKLRGIDNHEEGLGPTLDQLRNLLAEDELHDEALIKAFDRAREQPLFAWPGLNREV